MKFKLQDYAQIAEIVSAIAVIVTLLYLATEIRINTEAVQDNSAQEASRYMTELNVTLMENDHLIRLVSSLGRDDQELSAEDRIRLQAFYAYVLFTLDSMYKVALSGNLSEEETIAVNNRAGNYANVPGLREAALSNEHTLTQGFLSWMGYR
ncbi:MAG: hypothetical protein GKR91_05020 [Pseudomonadales bacterium]|nr:hypothetical protein [Pseudomonadales bacterium]